MGGVVYRCYDWGALGWLLASGRVDTSKYKFFMFLNSSIRGPFLPASWPVWPWPHGVPVGQRVFFIEAYYRAIPNQEARALRAVPCVGLRRLSCNSTGSALRSAMHAHGSRHDVMHESGSG